MPFRPFLPRAWLAGVALCALNAGAAAAKDLPATPEGAQKLNAFFATYLGAPRPGASPAYKITPEGSDYLVSFDLAAVAAPLAAAGFSYDAATLTAKLIEQDDGAWRVESGENPPVSAHTPHGSSTLAMTGYKSELVVDPKTAWFRTASGGADKATLHSRADNGFDETIETGAFQYTGTGAATAAGAVSSTIRESATGVGATIVTKTDKAGGDPKTSNASARIDNLAINANLDGLKSHAALDLWAFLVAHPSRPDLGANEAALKQLIGAATGSPLKLNEAIELHKFSAQTAQGPILMDNAKLGVKADTAAPGMLEEHIAFDGLSLPATLAPAPYRDFTPTSIDVDVKASGFDVAAASAEAIADLHLTGDGPPLSPEDRSKIWTKLIGGGPVTIDVQPSHIVAPRLDLSLEGQMIYKGGRPTGSFTLRMRNFDNTIAALKTLDPDTERKLVPALAMAKGLAKTEGDGVLTWVAEIGPDGAMKVNGLPLGKAPL